MPYPLDLNEVLSERGKWEYRLMDFRQLHRILGIGNVSAMQPDGVADSIQNQFAVSIISGGLAREHPLQSERLAIAYEVRSLRFKLNRPLFCNFDPAIFVVSGDK